MVVVDNVALSPGMGGVRMTPTVDAVEVAGLARAMTLKNAVAGLPYGGAKGTPDLDAAERKRVIRSFPAAIRDLVAYIPGPDRGTDETAMAWIYDEIGRAVGDRDMQPRVRRLGRSSDGCPLRHHLFVATACRSAPSIRSSTTKTSPLRVHRSGGAGCNADG